MGYKLKLKSQVLVWDETEKRYNRKEAETEFSFVTASALSGLIREMTTYADDPLSFGIIKED